MENESAMGGILMAGLSGLMAYSKAGGKFGRGGTGGKYLGGKQTGANLNEVRGYADGTIMSQDDYLSEISGYSSSPSIDGSYAYGGRR